MNNNQTSNILREQVILPTTYSDMTIQNAQTSKWSIVDLRTAWETILRLKWLVFWITLLITLASLLSTLLMTPVYRATTTLQISPSDTHVLEYDVRTDVQQRRDNSDYYQTQYELLRSRMLANLAIKELGLTTESETNSQEISWLSKTKSFLKKKFSPEESAAGSNDNLKLGVQPLADKLLENLIISPIQQSQVVKLHYFDTKPGRAVKIVNAWAKNYLNINMYRRGQIAENVGNFLQSELENSRKRLLVSEKKLNNYAREQGIVITNDNESLVSQKIKSLSQSLILVENERIRTQAEYDQSSRSAGVNSVFDSLTIQNMKQKLAKLEADLYDDSNAETIKNPVLQKLSHELVSLQSDYSEKQQIYKPAYPEMIQLSNKINSIKIQMRDLEFKNNAKTETSAKKQIEKLKNQISIETKSIYNAVISDLKSRLEAAKQKEFDVKQKLEFSKKEMTFLREKNVRLNEIKYEIETNRNIYEGLLNRQKEIGVAGGLGVNSSIIIDKAILPYSTYKPNLKLNIILGAALGLLLGMIVAFLKEYFDDKVINTKELSAFINLPLIGSTPQSSLKDTLSLTKVTYPSPLSPDTESWQSLKANLMLISKTGMPKVFGITSPTSSQDKSVSAIQIATFFAQAGKRVLLIDADLRHPTIHKGLGLDNSKGLSSFLSSKESIRNIVQNCHLPRMHVITSGPDNNNATNLLTEGKMTNLLVMCKKSKLDMVVFIMPPVLGDSDALLIASSLEGVAINVTITKTKRSELVESIKNLCKVNTKLLGLITSEIK